LGGKEVLPVVLVPFDGQMSSVECLRAACALARPAQGSVLALQVLRIPRQLPLSAELPSQLREAGELRTLAERVGREEQANVWAVTVQARETARAIADVAEEVGASSIMLGVAPGRWLLPWSLGARVLRLARCPVQLWSWPELPLRAGQAIPVSPS
jgi:nucleotide-binding universal stress UspA family protein